MSFDYPQQPRRRKKGGISGVVMLMLIGLALFFFMKSSGSGPSPGADDRGVEQRREGNGGVSRNVVDRELREADEYRRKREQVLGDSEPANAKIDSAKAMPTGRGSANSDWSIGGVDGKKKTTQPDAKKTTKGDWSVEEVPSKKESGSGFEVKNSAGGDVELTEKNEWSVEDVKSKNKKTKEGDWTLEEVEGGGK